MDDVPQMAARVQVRCLGEKTNTGYFRGCSGTLNIWFFEVTDTSKKLRFGKTPSILCYGENSCRKQSSLGSLLSSIEGKEVFRFLWSAMYKKFPLNILRFPLKIYFRT